MRRLSSSGALASDLKVVTSTPGITELVFDRPSKYNALSTGVVDELLCHLESASSDESTRLLVFRGNGRSMCAGFDFGGIEDQTDADLALRFLRLEMLLQAVHTSPVPTLALIQGACFGAGADLAMACTRRIATPAAKFRMPGLQFGVVLGTQRLARTVGTDKARSLLETSKVFGAQEALDCGFVNQLADEDEWPQLLADAAETASCLTREAQRAMLERTHCGDTKDADLAALARSVAVPGLKQRIVDFRKK